MEIILIPGFWLDASSWSEVTPALVQARHRVHPLTLPGLESRDAVRDGIGLRDHVEAVIKVVDEIKEPVALVGHSGGGAIAHAVADARSDRVARVVYVDSVPLGDGESINSELPGDANEIPLPPWTEFGEDDLLDLNDELRETFRARAVPQPAGVAREPQVLVDRRRYDVPATIIACEYSSDQLREWIAHGHEYVAELAAMHDVKYIDLPTGHWPQFTKPEQLAQAILLAIDRV
ncbi:MAG TPA: alpha/beta hydrolase [Acidimicrobiales bacterium]|nr:alpha/beta hydrolase [Acidimicrobiales bacterium]